LCAKGNESVGEKGGEKVGKEVGAKVCEKIVCIRLKSPFCHLWQNKL